MTETTLLLGPAKIRVNRSALRRGIKTPRWLKPKAIPYWPSPLTDARRSVSSTREYFDELLARLNALQETLERSPRTRNSWADCGEPPRPSVETSVANSYIRWRKLSGKIELYRALFTGEAVEDVKLLQKHIGNNLRKEIARKLCRDP